MGVIKVTSRLFYAYKRTPLPFDCEAEWDTVPVWTFWRSCLGRVSSLGSSNPYVSRCTDYAFQLQRTNALSQVQLRFFYGVVCLFVSSGSSIWPDDADMWNSLS